MGSIPTGGTITKQQPDIAAILALPDAEVRDAFARMRWLETKGRPVCPLCGGKRHYVLKTRCMWRCKVCQTQFSLTSNTIFANRKLPLQHYLAAIALFNAGKSAHAASKMLGVEYKSMWVLFNKLREVARTRSIRTRSSFAGYWQRHKR